VKYTDPDGNDIVLLNQSPGPLGYNHAAALIGNDKNGWTYYSKDGKDTTNQKTHFKTFGDFQKSDASEKYTSGFRVKTTEEQDKAMQSYGDANYNKPYSVGAVSDGGTGENAKENCADLAGSIIGASPADEGVPKPKISFPKTWMPFVGTFTVPKDQYQDFKERNPGQDIIPHIDVDAVTGG